MEQVLDVYKRFNNAEFPVVYMDESPKQLFKETRTPIASGPGRLERYDYEYERCGVANIFIANEPLAGKRLTEAPEKKTKVEWSYFVKEIEGRYPDAVKISLVMDNLNTHKPGSL